MSSRIVWTAFLHTENNRPYFAFNAADGVKERFGIQDAPLANLRALCRSGFVPGKGMTARYTMSHLISGSFASMSHLIQAFAGTNDGRCDRRALQPTP